jgi:hypothetical protein
MRKIPGGISDFKKLITEGFVYVDKTRFIEKLEDEDYVTFYRPRRFGKSLLLSTLEYYYDYKYKDMQSELFGGTYIDGNPTRFRSKYSVIKFDFSGIKSNNAVKGMSKRILSGIDFFLQAHGLKIDRELDEDGQPSEILDQFFTRIFSKLANPLYVLIDEYDHFANQILSENRAEFSEMARTGGYLRTFFEVLKEGTQRSFVGRIFITGVSPLTMDSLTSGFNIATNISFDNWFADMLGFTKGEASALIAELLPDARDKEGLLEAVTRLYNGYMFAREGPKLYNSEMAFYYIKAFKKTGRAPEAVVDDNTKTDVAKLKALASLVVLNGGGPELAERDLERRREALADILNGESYRISLSGSFGMDSFDADDFMAFLYYMGFLTYVSEGGVDALVLPNEAMGALFCRYFSDMILQEAPRIDAGRRKAAMDALAFKGSADLFVGCLSELLMDGDNRIYVHFAEKVFQLLGFTVVHEYTGYSAKLEAAAKGGGYIDLALLPVPKKKVSFYYIIEMKYIFRRELERFEKKKQDGGRKEPGAEAAAAAAEAEEERLSKLEKRRRVVYDKWSQALEQIRRYSSQPPYSDLDAEGRLKKLIIIFCTHRCLVCQDVADADNAEMQLADFEWWF